MEKIQDFVLGMGSMTKVRVCVEGRWEKARYTIDITIGDKTITVKDLELCHFCQVMIRDRIEETIFGLTNGK